MTMVILMIMALVTILFIGGQAWKRGSDRAICIINIQSVQKGMRSYANLYGLVPGSNATNLRTQIIGANRFIENSPICPASGNYTFGQAYGEDVIPPLGTLYMECSLATSNAKHVPNITQDW
jgi:hypothetical protein